MLRREPVCRVCGSRPATQVDHVIAISKGGSHSPNNLQAICGPCHNRKTNSERPRKAKWIKVGLDGLPTERSNK